MIERDFLRAAVGLVPSGPKRPNVVTLRMALSAAYYAQFHCLARICADTLIGGPNPDRTERAWLQTYRSLSHADAEKACRRVSHPNNDLGFPSEIVGFAELFPVGMRLRNRAHYDPTFRPRKGEVVAQIATVRRVVELIEGSSLRDRRAFAAYVLFESGRRNIARDRD